MGKRVRIKSSGISPGLANARPPGSAIFANAPQSRALTDALVVVFLMLTPRFVIICSNSPYTQ